jgi:hypothetical protein
MRLIVAVIFSAALLSFAGCESGIPTPTFPSAVVSQPASAPPAPPAAVAVARLEVSNFTATVVTPTKASDPFWYETRFRLTETTGVSGATIQRVKAAIAGGDSDETGPECWRTPIRVEPGGTLDVFDTGWRSLSYCAPGTSSRIEVSPVSVTITFADDFGGIGTVTATTTSTR